MPKCFLNKQQKHFSIIIWRQGHSTILHTKLNTQLLPVDFTNQKSSEHKLAKMFGVEVELV